MPKGKVSKDVKNWKAANPGKNAIGSRAQVMHGTAFKTAGGLTEEDLTYVQRGVDSKGKPRYRIVSVAVSENSREQYYTNPKVQAALKANSDLMKMSKGSGINLICTTKNYKKNECLHDPPIGKQRSRCKKCYSCKPRRAKKGTKCYKK